MPSKKITKHEIVNEIVRCGKDPVYFINKYARIQHATKGLVPFSLFPYQVDLINGFIDHRRNIILKGRQLGMTTLTAAFCSWFVLLHRDKNVLVIANKQDVAKNMIRVVQNIFKYLPPWLRDMGKIKFENRLGLELENGSRIKASATTSDAGRSEALSLLVVDECAIIDKFDEIWTGISPTISTGGNVILMSTPKGAHGLFHRLYTQAQNNENGFNCVFGKYVNPYDNNEVYTDRFPWWVRPDYDDNWFRQETADKTQQQIHQEYNCFVGKTRIFTDKGFKYIKDIKVGDKVLTHLGNFKPVIKAQSRVVDNVYELKTYGNRRKTIVTSEHPILSDELQWKKTEELLVKDRVCKFPKNVSLSEKKIEICLDQIIEPDFFKLKKDGESIYINDRKHKTKIINNIFVDYDLGFLIGLYLAEGNRDRNYIGFSFNREEELTTWVSQVCDIFSKKFGLENHKIYHSSSSKASLLQISSQIISKLFTLLVAGNTCYEKHLTEYAYTIGNKEYFTGIVDGLFCGDGCIEYLYDKTYTTVSEALGYDLQYLLTILNYGDFTFRKQSKKHTGYIQGRKVNIADSYEIKLLRTRRQHCSVVSEVQPYEIPKNYSYKHFVGENKDYVVTALLQKEKKEKSVRVYNIEVAEDHSFVTEHFVTHNCHFLASGDTFLYYDVLARLQANTKEPLRHFYADRNVWIWEEPDKFSNYIISADISRGDSFDYSAFHVLNVSANPIVQVAEYKGKIKPDLLGELLVKVASYYNNATIAPENNSGWSGPAIMRIEEARYPFLHYSKKRKPKMKDYVAPDPYYASGRNDYLPGYSVTSANREPMLARMEQIIRASDIVINSKRLVEEFKTFIINDQNKPIAQRGYNDDLVMALAGGLWVRDEALVYGYRSDEMTSAMLDGMSLSNTKTSHYRDFNFNSNIYDRGRVKEHIENQNKVVLGNGEVEDLSWLITSG